jgi:hypothetical protein
MTVIYMLFVCAMANGQPLPPCGAGTQYATAAECQSMTAIFDETPDRLYEYADGTSGKANRDKIAVCMQEIISPAKMPVWKRLR